MERIDVRNCLKICWNFELLVREIHYRLTSTIGESEHRSFLQGEEYLTLMGIGTADRRTRNEIKQRFIAGSGAWIIDDLQDVPPTREHLRTGKELRFQKPL
jgi:hypothetical protein